MKKSLLRKNKGVCCVCKEPGLAVQYHHIDGNRSNTVEENLAVLCVRDHDKEQRPHRYSKPHWTNLSEYKIKRYKKSWEAFIEEASKSDTNVLCFAFLYGEGEIIQALRLRFQWGDQVMWDKIFQATDFPLHSYAKQIEDTISWLGEHIQIVALPEPLPVKFCKKCESIGERSRLEPKLYQSITRKYTSTTWNTDSRVSVYVDPHRPLLAFTVDLKGEFIHGVFIYKQGKSITTFCSESSCGCSNSSYGPEFSTEKLEEFVEFTLKCLLAKWEPAKCITYTLKDTNRVLLDDFSLHAAWYEENDTCLSDLLQSSTNTLIQIGKENTN
jgi:hypothetical protein